MYGPWNPYAPPMYPPQQPVMYIPMPANTTPPPQGFSSLKDVERWIKLTRKEEDRVKKAKEEEDKKKKDGEKKPSGMSFPQAMLLLTIAFPIVAPLFSAVVAGSIRLSWMILSSAVK